MTEMTIEYSGPSTNHKNKTFSGNVGLIQSQLLMLQDYRDDGRVPSEQLLWEIRLYEYMLAQPDQEKTIRQYMDTRTKIRGTVPLEKEKRETVKILGWTI
jgi:hypothetical protein